MITNFAVPGRASQFGRPIGSRRSPSIFPEDVAALGGLRADVLVTHEAPTTQRRGFFGIDTAARLCRAKLFVHCCDHMGSDSFAANGIKVIGLAKAEVLRLAPGDFN